MWEYFKAVGPVMWPLLAMALVSLTVIFERSIFWLRYSRHRDKALMNRFLELVGSGDFGMAANIAQGTQDRVLRALHGVLMQSRWPLKEVVSTQAAAADEIGRMKKYLTTLKAIVAMAPMLGLLGTVIGIMGAFQVLGVRGIPDLEAIMVVSAEALITTAFGIIIALATFLPYSMLSARVDGAREEIAKYVSLMEILFQSQQNPMKQDVESCRGPKDEPAMELVGLSEKEKRFFLSK